MSKRNDFDYLDEERQKLWAELVYQRGQNDEDRKKSVELEKQIHELQVALEKKPSDFEREARNASTQATKYKNRAEESARRIEEAGETVAEVIKNAAAIEDKLSHIEDKYAEILSHYETSQEQYANLQASQSKIASLNAAAENALLQAEQHLESSSTVAEKIEQLKLSSDSTATKINNAHNQAVKRSQEVTDLHHEVFGYTYSDEEGNEIKTEGLKAELDGSYSLLKKNISDFNKDLEDLKKQKALEFSEFRKAQTRDLDQLKKQIRDLLPQAMTAGLSHAYEEKRKSEEAEGKQAEIIFRWSIAVLLVISIIPVVVSLYSLFHDRKNLDEIIHNIPQVVLAILPLYAPAFWFAISASKRIKLAKRLTEEYAHKEALSKTFEGLSTQIGSLPDSKSSRELKIRLLYNIISASSDNPGKLISDYNNSDNPILEVLDKSLSLSKSLERISSIPGVGRILRKIEQSKEEKLEVIENSVEENIPAPKPA